MNDVISINYQDDYNFYIVFDDGVAGNIDLSKYISRGTIRHSIIDSEPHNN